MASAMRAGEAGEGLRFGEGAVGTIGSRLAFRERCGRRA